MLQPICDAAERWLEPEKDGIGRLPEDKLRVQLFGNLKDNPPGQLAILQRLSTPVGKLDLSPQEGSKGVLIGESIGDLLPLLPEVDREVLCLKYASR